MELEASSPAGVSGGTGVSGAPPAPISIPVLSTPFLRQYVAHDSALEAQGYDALSLTIGDTTPQPGDKQTPLSHTNANGASVLGSARTYSSRYSVLSVRASPSGESDGITPALGGVSSETGEQDAGNSLSGPADSFATPAAPGTPRTAEPSESAPARADAAGDSTASSKASFPTHEEHVANYLSVFLQRAASDRYAALSQRKRKLLLKLRAAFHVICLVNYYFKHFMESPAQCFVDLEPVKKTRAVHSPQKRLRKAGAGEPIDISQTTKRVLAELSRTPHIIKAAQSDAQKGLDSIQGISGDFGGPAAGGGATSTAEDDAVSTAPSQISQGRRKMQRGESSSTLDLSRPLYGRKVSEYELELRDEQDGIMYTYRFEDGTRVRVPIKKSSALVLSRVCSATACLYVPETSQVLLGDDTGYVTCYDFSGLISAIEARPVAIKSKTITSTLATAEASFVGFEEQQVPKRLLRGEGYGRLTPLLDASECVRIDYVHRAHMGAVRRLYRGGTRGESYFSLGEDSRVLCWRTRDAVLEGILQRVNLDAPGKYWENLYLRPLVPPAQVGKGADLTVQNLDAMPANEGAPVPSLSLGLGERSRPPPLRIEAPPSCAYPWAFSPDAEAGDDCDQRLLETFRESESTPKAVLNRTFSAGAAGSARPVGAVEATKRILSARLPVLQPVFSTPTLPARRAAQGSAFGGGMSTPEAILKTTGISPAMLATRGSSWTVRAMVARSLGVQGGIGQRGFSGEEDLARYLMASQARQERLQAGYSE